MFNLLFVERMIFTDLLNTRADAVGAVLKVRCGEIYELSDFVHILLVKPS